jgi:site-specific DNA-methyltransferase (adenine-specific)
MTLYNGDCLIIMDMLIKEGIKVDAVIADPPYGITACKWDSLIPFNEMWKRLKLLRKDCTPIVLFGSEPFSSALRMSNIKEYKYDWIWNKRNAANFLNANYQPLKIHEIISVFGKLATSYSRKGNLGYYPIKIKSGKPYKCGRGRKGDYTFHSYPIPKNTGKIINERFPVSILEYKRDSEKYHANQKPKKLMEYLIKTYTNENDLVLDFTMGSGTTGVACKKLKRKFIGIEKDNKYFNIAEKRIKLANNKEEDY